jgi:hypothetical protein
LNQDDQLILIKLGFLEVWLAHSAGSLVQSEQTLCLPDGSFATRAQLETIYDVSVQLTPSSRLFTCAEILDRVPG